MTESGSYGNYPSWVFQYYYLLHKNALGNFKTFVEDIGRTPAMLHYLDGRLNIKTDPMKIMHGNCSNCLQWGLEIIPNKMSKK